jgi:hypothetical protein
MKRAVIRPAAPEKGLKDIARLASRPQKHAPKLRRANDHQEYAESDDITQGFVFHSRFPLYVRLLFYIPFLFFWQVNAPKKIGGAEITTDYR